MDKDHNYYSFLAVFIVALASIITLVLSPTFAEGIISTIILIILAVLYLGAIKFIGHKFR